MLHALDDPALDHLLARVSRSFYLSLAVLPRAVRRQMALAYLLARAADTVADALDEEAAHRCVRLRDLRAALGGERDARSSLAAWLEERSARRCRRGKVEVSDAAEAEERLLARLPSLLGELGRLDPADRDRVVRVLGSLLTGMERDLARARSLAWPLRSLEELDEHCYLAAGCVGEFWSEMTAAHLPEVAHLASERYHNAAISLGKALQLVNVLRDAPADLQQGRCYIPAPLLAVSRLGLDDLRHPQRRRAARPVFRQLCRMALAHVDTAWSYVRATPARAPRLRLACIWPLWIGLGTLERLAGLDDPLDPLARRKLGRNEVYRLMAESTAVVMIDPLLEKVHHGKRAALERVLTRRDMP